jgi:hypothetical protein
MFAKVAGLFLVIALFSFGSLAAGEKKSAADSPKPKIAPVFKKGPGYATFGSMSFGQPPFLNAGEAISIINSELISAGLVFGRTAESFAGNDITFILDGYDRRHNVGFKFLSLEDYTKYANIYNEKRKKSPYQMLHGTYALDFRLMATELLKAAKEQDKIHFVVFYDPCADSINDSKLWLAEQVAAFVKWARKNSLIDVVNETD